MKIKNRTLIVGAAIVSLVLFAVAIVGSAPFVGKDILVLVP